MPSPSVGKMAAGTLILVLCALLAQVGAESGPLVILHSYPEPGNYSYVELSCVITGSALPSYVVSGARFQLNGTDIGEEVETRSSGAVRLVLTQEKEGFFTCFQNGSFSNNSIGLAGRII